MRQRILEHLKALVACDTRNPPRGAAGIDALFAHTTAALVGFDVVTVDLGDGCRWLHATRGTKEQLARAPIVNVHIDTVPLADEGKGWKTDPFTLVVDDKNATGLGACDIKGAVACFIDAALDAVGPASLLLTSDEEAGSSRCVRTFIAQNDVVGRSFLVAEPTQAKAVLAHRGIGTALVSFTGVGGHASQQRATVDSAVARCVRFCARALDRADAVNNAFRLNLGRVEGGTKANMIAATCFVRLGVRPDASLDPAELLDHLATFAGDPSTFTLEKGFIAPPLPGRFAARSVDDARAAAAKVAARYDLAVGPDVDFFTEAAFFSAAGANALVFGPGNIEQAHAVDEFVALDDLDNVAAAYRRIIAASASVSAQDRP